MDSASTNRGDRIYARCFRDEGKGHPLYRNITTERMRPGTCGYFDHTGSWVRVFQVAEFEDPGNSTQQGIGTMVNGAINWMFSWNAAPKEEDNAPETADAGPAQQDAVRGDGPNIEPLAATRVDLYTQKDDEEWGMKASRQVNLKNFEVAANVAPPNSPIGGRFLATYQSFSREGAMLVTQGPVSFHQADPQPVFETWMDQHLPALLAGDHGALIRKRGIWIVTRTYTATRCAVAVLQSRSATVSFAVDAALPQQIARVGPSAGWWSETVREPGWETHNGPNDVVLFMSGIYWKPRRVSKKFKVMWEQKTKNVLAAGHPYQPVVVESNVDKGSPPEYFCMSPQVVGQVEAADGVPRLDFWDYEDAEEDIEDDSDDD
ncbi:hypothetical protein Daus18300_010778 [Diaporthe australafricana]|uniref:Uncharacterized protein n=1 Tax=Diaporthe australafricana TaxID=127596 RepID=A0ABR3W976_9PEZI